jgi:hypothetical protein
MHDVCVYIYDIYIYTHTHTHTHAHTRTHTRTHTHTHTHTRTHTRMAVAGQGKSKRGCSFRVSHSKQSRQQGPVSNTDNRAPVGAFLREQSGWVWAQVDGSKLVPKCRPLPTKPVPRDAPMEHTTKDTDPHSAYSPTKPGNLY